MKRFLTLLAPVLLAATLLSGDAVAWEAATTHAGLTEQSALSSELHKRLQEQFANSQGLYSMLTVPKKDAPQLFEIVARLNPTHGYVPDASGRMSALSWLVLGSVVADVPAAHALNHFFDPHTGEGLKNSTESGFTERTHLAALRAGRGPSLTAGGMSAQQWWKAPENPLGYGGFASQFRKAVSAETPAARDRHLAGSLLAAGAMLHVLQDMGAPSRVRNDIAAHQQQVGSSETDRGSRFERIAALSFGRLGIPRAKAAPTLESLADHLSNAKGTGLADIVANSYFSIGTLPLPFKVTRNTGSSAFRASLANHLRRPAPAAASEPGSARFDLVAARNSEGATWRSEDDTCLAEYRIKDAKVTWSISDVCALDQLEALLPTVAGYGISFLETLYPADLSIGSTVDGTAAITFDAKRYASGTVRFFSEGNDGKRTEFFSGELKSGTTAMALPTPPASATRITALFDGTDTLGKPLLATTSTTWPLP